MSKSKYTKHEKEIFEMKAAGKTNAKISKILNKKNKGLGADQNSLKVFLKRDKDKKNGKKQKNIANTVPENQERVQKKEEKEQTNTTKTVPENQEKVPKKEERKKDVPKKSIAPVIDTTPLNNVHKDLVNTQQDYQVNNKVYSTINNALGVTAQQLENVAMRKAYPFLITGIFFTIMATFSLGDIYITRCLPRRDAWIIGAPAGLPFMVALNIIILYKAGLGRFINKLIIGGTAFISTAALTIVLKVYIPGETGLFIGLGIFGLTLFCLLFPKKKDK